MESIAVSDMGRVLCVVERSGGSDSVYDGRRAPRKDREDGL
jgi:hypothetical protein